MIKLDIEEYCQECHAFKPDVIRQELYYYGAQVPSDTVVMCERRNLCKSLVRYLEKRLKSKEMSNE